MIVQLEQEPQTHVMNISKFERFFRMGAGLDVDKQDLKRYNEFVHHKLYDLLLRGNRTAGANGRDVVEFFDLPITNRLQECIQVFREIDEDIELQPILDRLVIRPPLGREPGHRSRTSPDHRWIERRAGAKLQDYRTRAEKSGDETLGTVVPPV